MCEKLSDLLKCCEDSYDEITYISLRNKILIGIGNKWSFNDLISAISGPKIDYCKYKLLVEVLERREGWNTNISQLIGMLQVQDEEGTLCELKLSLIYLLTTCFDPLDPEIVSNFTVFTVVLNDIFDKIHIGSLKFLHRNIFLSALTKLIDAYQIVKDNNTDNIVIDNALNAEFCYKLCNQIRGEKDPRNLLIMFPLLKKLSIYCSDTAKNGADICNDISQMLLTYYPINFKPPKHAPQSITENDLIIALNNALSSQFLWRYVIDVFIDGLYGAEITDDEALEFLDKNVQTIVYCLPHYGHECALKYLPQAVEALASECFLSAAQFSVIPTNDVPIDIEYEIGPNLENCQRIILLPQWIPGKKQRLLSDVLQAFLQNIPPYSECSEGIWNSINFLLERAKNSILSHNNDLLASLHIVKTVASSSPLCIAKNISEFLHNIITQIPIKMENMGKIAQLIAVSILYNNKSGKIMADTASKLCDILKFIESTVCDDVTSFIDIIQVISTLTLPDNFVYSVCQKVNKMAHFGAHSEDIIVNLSQQKGSIHFLTKLFESLSESLLHAKCSNQTTSIETEGSLSLNVEKADLFFNYLSQNTTLLRYSHQSLSSLYNKLNDELCIKRICFIWTISAMATRNPDDYYWYKYAKSLSSIDQTVERWICQILSSELISKSEFRELLDDISDSFSCKILDHILDTYRDNMLKLIFIPWLERHYNTQHYNSAEIILQELKVHNHIYHNYELQLSLLPIFFKYPNEFLTINYNMGAQLFGLVKQSEITATDLWSKYINDIIIVGKFGEILSALPDMLDELCPLRIIPGETWQIVLDTWINPKNYHKSLRITQNVTRDLNSVLLDKIYYIDSISCVQRISFANSILCNLNEHLLKFANEYTIDAHRSLIRLLSSIPISEIDQVLPRLLRNG